ncbi:MAG: hypothetical protein HDT33_07415 [Clostridiales bacterium]|nr:hypothetical protein [Clostridiales bacterium]
MDLWYQVKQEFPNHKLHIVPFEDNHRGILSEIAALGEKYDFLVAACDSEKWLDLCGFQQLGAHTVCTARCRGSTRWRKENTFEKGDCLHGVARKLGSLRERGNKLSGVALGTAAALDN